MTVWWTVGCDASDPQALAAFWATALGYVPEAGFDGPDNASIVDPEGRGPAVGFLRVPEGKTAKNRFHLDVRVSRGVAPEQRETVVLAHVARLVAAGATQVRVESYGAAGGGLGHVVMTDPEGNEFCVA